MIRTNIRNVMRELEPHTVLLVAVSKFKNNQEILEAYEEGQRHFGENYVQELCKKAETLPKDIKWHLIGHLTRKNCNQLVRRVENLYMVETVDSPKIATQLDMACKRSGRTTELRVMIQVKTSCEENKEGIDTDIDQIEGLINHVFLNCSSLRVDGLMTIADPNNPKECFIKLKNISQSIFTKDSQLSMGMSDDWRAAIEAGSTEVRIGSLIFGKR